MPVASRLADWVRVSFMLLAPSLADLTRLQAYGPAYLLLLCRLPILGGPGPGVPPHARGGPLGPVLLVIGCRLSHNQYDGH